MNRLRSTLAERAAIERGGDRIGYGVLDRASAALCSRMLARGVGKGQHVGVLAADRCIVLAAAIAAWKCRAVFVPLNAKHPIPYLETSARHLDLSLLIADAEVEDAANKLSAAVSLPYILIDRDLPNWSHAGDVGDAIPGPSRDDDPIYIYATSGTTGRPKAIVGRSASLLHFLRWEIQALGLSDSVRVSQLTSPTHDPYLRDVFVPLLAGGTVCIPEDPNVVLSGAALADWIEASGVHLVHCTPSIFRNLCNARLENVEFASLRWVLLAGEQLYGKDLVRWYERFGERIELVNVYGPTETTLAKFYHPIARAETLNGRIPIGRPIHDTRFEIVAAHPGDSVGELVITTAYSTLGYYKDDELTARSFERTAEGPHGGEVAYRTGDLVRRLESGALEIVGRGDEQIKLFGERIELDELTRLLLAHPDVRSGIVRTITEPDDGRAVDLVAYYVAERSDLETVLRQHFTDHMPRFKVPRFYARIEKLPLNTNGKLDTTALPDPRAGAAVPTAPAEPGDQLEARLVAIWSELLGREQIGLDQIFMEIGGDSLSIMLLVGRIADEFGFELSLWEIFEDLTIKKLAGRIREAKS